MFRYIAQLKNIKGCEKFIYLTSAGTTYFPEFQGARPDHVRVESSSCGFPKTLVGFVHPRELVRSETRLVTRDTFFSNQKTFSWEV